MRSLRARLEDFRQAYLQAETLACETVRIAELRRKACIASKNEQQLGRKPPLPPFDGVHPQEPSVRLKPAPDTYRSFCTELEHFGQSGACHGILSARSFLKENRLDASADIDAHQL